MKRFKMFFGLGIFLFTSSVVFSLVPNVAQADVPKLINFQGILRDGSGNPVANSSYSVTFKIYDASTGGNQLWMENQSVATTNGLFTVLLGASTPVPDSVFEDTLRWLGITVAPDLIEMAPRQQLVSVGYSFAFAGWTISDSNLILAERLGGSIGIGTNSPEEKLDVAGNIKADTVKAAAFSSTSPLRLQTSGTTRIFVDDLTGWVGLGTETPTRMLELGTGDVRLSSSTAEIGYSASADLAGRADDPAPPNPIAQPPNPCFRLFSGVSRDLVFAVNNSGDIFTGGAIKSGNSIVIDGINNKISSSSGTIGFDNDNLVSIGQVGIGTAGAVSPLTIQPVLGNEIEFPNTTANVDIIANNHFNVGTANSTSNLSLLTNNVSRVTVLGATGNVGIGTASPAPGYGLHVKSSADNMLRVESGPGATVDIQALGTRGILSASGALGIHTSGTEKVRISTTGEVGIGTALPATPLHISGTESRLRLESSSTTGFTVTEYKNNTPRQWHTGVGGSLVPPDVKNKYYVWNDSLNEFKLVIEVDGDVGIGVTSPVARLEVQQSGATVAAFDRQTNDGTVVSIQQAGTEEGTISVSGTTVSYNAFTGSHYGWTEELLERGELVTLTGKNRSSHDNPKSEVIYGVKRSTIPNDPACLGSYLGLQESSQPASPENPHLVMAVGNGDMWAVDEGKDIEIGDYLISSATAGHAMKENGQYAASYVVARAAEPARWNEVSETAGGKKHRKISVFFESFVKVNTLPFTSELSQLKAENESFQRKMEELQSLVQKLLAKEKGGLGEGYTLNSSR